MNKNPIWKYLSENNLTTLDEQAWVNEYSSNAEKQTKLYNYLSSNNLTTLDQSSFVNKYLGKPEGVQTAAATAAPATPEEPQQPTTFQQPSPLLEQELPIGVASARQLKYQEADPTIKSYADKIKSISEFGITQEQSDEIERQIEEPKLTSRLVKSFGDFKTITEEKYAYENYLDKAKKLYADQENVNISAVTDDQAIPVAKDLLRSELKNQITNEQRKQVLDNFEDEYSEGFVDNLKKIGFGVARLTNFGLIATASEIGLGKIIESDVLPEGVSEEYVAPVKDFFASVNETLTSKEDLEYEQGRKELKELIAQASEDKKTLAENKRKNIDVDVLAFDDNVEKAEELKKQINALDNKFKLGEELSEEEINAYNSTVQEFNGLAKDINYLGNKINKQAEELNDINVSSSDLEKAVEQAGKSYNALDVTVSRVVGSGLQLTSGVLNLYDDFLSITPTGVMINAISDELDLPSITSSVLNDTEKTSLIESFADKLKEIDKEEFTGKVRETQDYRTAFKSGDNFLDFALDVVSGQSINTAITAATGGVGLAILGGSAYGNKVDELEDRIQGKGDYALKGPEDIPLWKYYTTGLIVGGAEAASEYVGLRQVRALGKSIGRVAKASPGNRAWYDLSTKKWSRKFAENVVQNAWQPIEEGGSESIAQIAQNAADVYILGDDKNILEGVDEAFITGATFSGLAMSAPKTFLDAAVAFRSSDMDARINKRTKKINELALRKQKIKDKENKTQEDLDILKEITAEQEILIQENFNEVGNVVTLLDELNFGQKQALIKNETKRASLIRKAKDISESKDLTKEQKENQIKELETQFRDLKNKKDLMLLKYNFDRQSQVAHLYNTARASETGKEVKIIDAENIEDAEIKVNAALNQALQDGSITQEEYNKSKKEFAELKKESKTASISGQAINADNNLPFMLTLKNEAVDPNNGDSFVHGHELLHSAFFNKIRALSGNVVKISDLLYNHYKNNYITDKKQLREFESDYKELKQKGTKEAESVWHEERIIAITKMIALAERSGKLDKSFLGKIKSTYNGLFTNPTEKTEANKLKSGEDVFNMFLTYGTRFMSGDVKELVKLEKGLDIDASLIGEKIDTGAKFSRKELGDSIKALIPEGTTKSEYDSEVISTVYLDLIAGNKLHPLINNNLARFGVPKEQVTDEFYEDVKNQLFERSLQRFNPEVNDDLGGFVINELQRFSIPDIVNQYKSQGRFQTTEQIEAAPTEGRVRPMQVAEETTTEEIVERAEEQEAKVEEQTFREKLGIKEGSNVYNSVVESVRRTFGTKLPAITDSKYRIALIKSFKTDLMKPMKDFIGKKERYRNFVFNNFDSIMEKIPTREWVRLEQQEQNKIFAELVTARASTEEVDNAVSKGLYLLPGASRVSGTSIYRKLDTTPEQLWKFLAGNNAQINGARKTALTERLVQELAFDATMMVLKDPKYNAFARVQEIAELTGGTLPANFDAELGAVIERDPSIRRFSITKQNKAYEAIVSTRLFEISPKLIDQDIVEFISQLANTFGYLSQSKEDIEALARGKKGARTRAINRLKNTFEKFETGQSFEEFIEKINSNNGIQNIIPNLLNSYNKLDNGKKYETIFVIKGNSLLKKLNLSNFFEFRLSPEQGFDVELYDKENGIVLDKIELKYGSPENGPWLTSVVYNSIFDEDSKLNGGGKTARNIGSSEKFLIQTINEKGNKELIQEFVGKAMRAGAKINNSGNGFDFETTEQRQEFEKSLDGNKPLIIAEKDDITNEKQLSEFGKSGMTMHYSEGTTYQVGSMNEKNNLQYNNSTIPEFKADLYNKIMFSRSENNYSLRVYLQVKELKLSPENNKNIEDSNTLKSYIESVTRQSIKPQDGLKKFPNVRLSKKHRGQYETSLAKRRGDLNKEQITEQVDSIFNWLDTTDVPNQKKKKFEELALFYMYQPGFILPEDGFKIIEAERIASIKGIDPRSYSNPTELINEFGDTVKKAYINPGKVSTLTRIEEGAGGSIDLYEVDNSKKGQDDLADIVESHLGRKTSPWCITAKKDGKVNREIWDEYGNYKVAAFKDGKIHAIGVGSKPIILSDNKSMAFLQKIEIPYTRETFDLYYDSTTDDLAIEYFDPATSSKTFYEWDEVSSYFDFEGPSLDRESFKAIGRLLFPSENKNIAFIQKITLPSTGETFDIYYNNKKNNLEIKSAGTDYKVDEISKYFIEDGAFFDQEYFKAIGESVFKDGKAKGIIDNWWDRRDVPHKQIPTNTIRFSKKAKDAKGVAKDVKAKETLDQTFNTILEQRTGIKAAKEYSKVQARAAAQKKKYRSFYIPPSAEDFLGLMYAFLSPGKKGEQQLKFFKDSLITPMNEAFNDWAQAKYVVARDFKALLKKHKGVRKRLNKFIPNTDFTIDQAIRIYLYDKAGHSVPGISEAELKTANNFVIENQDIYDFANELRPITRIPEGFKKPDENWIASTLTSEMYEISQEVVRSQFFEKINENLDTIFNENNLNKIEAYYGPKFREALEDSIYSIKTGSKRSFGDGNRHLNEFNDWLNGSVGVIMFLNSRSAVLQTISSINYINWSDNNIAKAAAAFANQKQFWSDFTYLFNSPYLKERRSGLQSDINLAELQASVATSKNKAKAAIKYLLEKGFIFTKVADSFAIASGGATFYRNRIKTYTKQGLSQKEAEAKAFTDFQNLTETNQQSSRPDKISQQQRGPLGRVILAFQNTPGQYGREIKKASLDLINGRGDIKTNISKIVYYGAVQNLIFNALQTGLFALLFDDDDEPDEQWFDRKGSKVANGIIDTILRGTGITGAIIATTKNVILEWVKQQSKGWNSDSGEIIVEALNISPPLGSKARRLKVAHDILKYDSDLVKAYGYDIDNPLVDVSANIISATTNVPLDRMLRKIDNVSAALDADNEIWQRIATAGGWNTWDVGIEDAEKEEMEAKAKEEKKQAKKEAKKPKGNDPVPTYNRKTYKRKTYKRR